MGVDPNKVPPVSSVNHSKSPVEPLAVMVVEPTAQNSKFPVIVGGRIISTEVVHRSRGHGNSKYGLFDRLWVGIIDIFGVMWLKHRKIKVEVEEI